MKLAFVLAAMWTGFVAAGAACDALATPGVARGIVVPEGDGISGPPTLPPVSPASPEYKAALEALRARMKEPAPGASEREEREVIRGLREINPQITKVLTGHHVILLANDAMAEAAGKSELLLNLDLGYEVLRSLWGVDPNARVGRRFVIWPDPNKPGGHHCLGRELIIAVGRSDWEGLGWYERFFHEMTHGFQYMHPADYLMKSGFFEGWAEFMQAAVCDHLAPLGSPYVGRFAWYSQHFPQAAGSEYVRTRLPIEEMISYDPAAGLLMELVNTTKDIERRPDWGPIRKLLQDPITEPRWSAWHLWPALMAHDLSAAFGEAKSRPILAKFRFPLDSGSLAAAARLNRPMPEGTLRVPITEWKVVGPLENVNKWGIEWDPLCAEDMAWRWSEVAATEPAPPLEAARKLEWREMRADERGVVPLADREGGAAYFYLAAHLPEGMRGPLTLFIASDDECQVWIDGGLVHLFRGDRGCDPTQPDVAYADATDGPGQIVVLVMNHGGVGAFSMAVAAGGLLFDGAKERMGSADAEERVAGVAYLASRRWQQPVRRLLEQAGADAGARARCWWPDLLPREGGDYKEAEEAYPRGTIVGGFFGQNLGTSGNQCVARGWGTNAANWMSLPLLARKSGAQTVRVRYASPADASVKVRVRMGDRIEFTSALQRLRATGKDWNHWGWLDVAVPHLERGVYWVELLEPGGGADIDAMGIRGR